MKFYIETERTMGLDYYAEIAQRIVDARERAGLTQDQLAKKLGWKVNRVSAAENVRIRLKLEDMEALAKALGVQLCWLIGEELDAGGKECMYLIWLNRCANIKLYSYGASAQAAYFAWYDKLRKLNVRVFESNREFAKVRLVGVPVSTKEIQTRFRKADMSVDEELPGRGDEEEEPK